jgi:hypothetical protein
MDFPIYVHDDNGFNFNIASEFSVNYTKNDVLDNTTFFKWIGLSNTSFFWSFTEKVLHLKHLNGVFLLLYSRF